MLVLKILFWASLGALVWTHVALPARRRRARARPHARVSASEAIEPHGDRDRRRLQRGGGDRAAAREPARARLPAPRGSSSSSPPTPRPTARDELVERFGDRRAADRATRAAARSPPRTAPCARPSGEIVAFSDANATWAPDALRKLVAQLRRPRRRLRLRAAACSRRPTARTGRASTGATRWRCARPSRGSARSPAATARSTRCAASDYVEVDPRFGPRPLVPVPDGAARPPRGLRAGGARVREADAVERDRVPAQGAHVRALLADRAARQDAAAACRSATCARDRLAPALRYAQRLLHLVLLATSLALVGAGLGLPGRARGAARCCSLAAAVGVGIARYYVLVTWATVVALWNYLRRGVPATWEAAEGTR